MSCLFEFAGAAIILAGGIGCAAITWAEGQAAKAEAEADAIRAKAGLLDEPAPQEDG